MAALPQEFYSEGFDPLAHIFRNLPDDLNEAWLNAQIEENEKVKAVIESTLSDRVLSSYGAFGRNPSSAVRKQFSRAAPVSFSSGDVADPAAGSRSPDDDVLVQGQPTETRACQRAAH